MILSPVVFFHDHSAKQVPDAAIKQYYILYIIFNYCNSICKVHSLTQILSSVSKNTDGFSLKEAPFSVLIKKNY